MSAEPLQIRAGDTATWTRSVADYPASAGWTLTTYLSLGAAAPIAATAAASGDAYLTTISAATTAGWTPGTYHWAAAVAKSSERYTVAEGVLDVLPNITASVDRRTHAEKALAAITAVLEGRLTESITEYQIDGVVAKHMPHQELVRLRAQYAAMVRREKGCPSFRPIPLRLNRA